MSANRGASAHQRAGEDIREQQVCASRNCPSGSSQSAQPLAQAVRARVVARGDQRLRVDVEAARGCAPSLQRSERQHPGAAAVVDHARRAGVDAHRAIRDTARSSGECRCRRRAPDRASPPRHPAPRPARAADTPTAAAPKRIAWKSRSHSRSQARSATSRARSCSGSTPSARLNARTTAARSVAGGKRATRRVAGHSRNSPGAARAPGPGRDHPRPRM